MAISNNRPAKGLKPEAALERWSDPVEWADMHQYEDARERISTASGKSPYELRNKEYWKRREPLEKALLEKLRSGELIGTFLGDDRQDGRFILHYEQWHVLWIDYDWRQAEGEGDVFEKLEIAEITAIPKNVEFFPRWVQERLASTDEAGEAESFDGVIHDAEFRHITVSGQDQTFGDLQSKIIKILYEAAGTQNPWRFGKVMLEDAGSGSRNINELFRSKEDWRMLIESDRRGYYRLQVRLKPGWST